VPAVPQHDAADPAARRPARRGAGPQPVTGPRRHLRGRDPLRTLRPAARGSADAVRLRARTRWPRRDTARHRRTDRSHARGRCADARGPGGGSEGMSQVMIREAVPQLELLDSGHLACPGCGAPLAMRLVLKELGEKTVVVLPACCWSIIAGPYPQSSLHVPSITPHSRPARPPHRACAPHSTRAATPTPP